MNDPVTVRFHALPHARDGEPPQYATDGAAGADLRAAIGEPVGLEPGRTVAVPTGLAVELPAGFEMQVRPRSGLAFRDSVTVANAPGTVDSDYRGEVMVILINLGRERVTIEPGQRIAQAVVAPVVRARFVAVDTLGATDRGDGGFGSTGRL